MAEEEKQSEPVTDKNELQKLKVFPFSWVVFLPVTAKIYWLQRRFASSCAQNITEVIVSITTGFFCHAPIDVGFKKRGVAA